MRACTPRRVAISRATSTSNPFQVAVLPSYHERGLLRQFVATRTAADLQMFASASVPERSTEEQIPVLVDPDAEQPDASRKSDTTSAGPRRSRDLRVLERRAPFVEPRPPCDDLEGFSPGVGGNIGGRPAAGNGRIL